MRPFLFFEGDYAKCNDWLKANAFSKIILLCDANTNGFCVSKVKQQIETFRHAELIVIPQGEAYKQLETVTYIWGEMDRIGIDRYSLLVNVGGGVVSDMGGFAAAIYKRGISYINIPTTLIGMLDASVGGKTGIDFHQIKNHLGCVHHPLAVYVNPGFLQTLDQRILQSGISEAVKHHLLAGNLTEQLLSSLDSFYTSSSIQWSLEFKLGIVEQDPHDLLIRQQLNLGHTVGHAIESASLQSDHQLYHGEAIWLGLLIELRISELLFNYPTNDRHLLLAKWKEFFPNLSYTYQADELRTFLLHDKKNMQGLRMSLLRDIGDCGTGIDVSEMSWLEALQSFQTVNNA